MNSLNRYQIFPPSDEKEFENYVKDVFNYSYNTDSFNLYGRKGEDQDGIDIYSAERKIVIQCKHKLINRLDNKIKGELIKALNEDFENFLIFNKKNQNLFNCFIFASTFKNDTKIIQECFKLQIKHNFKIEYWHWDKLLENSNSEISYKYYELFFQKNKDYYLPNNEIFIDKKLNFVDQLYCFFKLTFEEINILNSKYFINQYPFKSEFNFAYRIGFTLISNDQKLLDFFNSFEILQNGEINTKKNDIGENEKIKFIIECFVRNNILHFKNESEATIIDLNKITLKNDNYFKCLDTFKYIHSLKQVPIKENSVENLMELGYFYYKLGDLLKSIEIFKEARDLSLEKQNIKHLICNHNLQHLGNQLRFRYWNLPGINNLIHELTSIDLNSIYVEKKDSFIKDLIISRKFLNEPSVKILNLTEEIVQNYHSYLAGSVSSKNYDLEIFYEYGTLYAFLEKNQIIYDLYKDFKDLVHTLLNSLLASYSIKKGGDRITELDIFEVSHLIEYGDAKIINQLFRRYNIDEIDYSNYPSDYNYINLLENFVTNTTTELKERLKEKVENFDEFNQNFSQKSNSIFKNFLVLGSLLKFNKEDNVRISESIMRHIKNIKLIHRFDVDFLYKYINFKCEFFPISHLKFYLMHLIENSQNYLLQGNITIFYNHFKKKNIKILFTKNEIAKIKKNLFKHDSQNRLVYDLALELFENVDETTQDFIKSKLEIEFKKNRDFEIYYKSVVYGIFDYNYTNYFNEFIDNYNSNIAIETRNTKVYYKNFNDLPQLNDFFNICFKYSIDIKSERFIKFKKVSSYFEWLADIDSFNYKDFDVQWINMYTTKYYDDYFRKSEILKKNILIKLSSSEDNLIRKIYNRIYI